MRIILINRKKISINKSYIEEPLMVKLRRLNEGENIQLTSMEGRFTSVEEGVPPDTNIRTDIWEMRQQEMNEIATSILDTRGKFKNGKIEVKDTDAAQGNDNPATVTE